VAGFPNGTSGSCTMSTSSAVPAGGVVQARAGEMLGAEESAAVPFRDGGAVVEGGAGEGEALGCLQVFRGGPRRGCGGRRGDCGARGRGGWAWVRFLLSFIVGWWAGLGCGVFGRGRKER